MMKILAFESPQDDEEFEVFSKAYKYKAAITDMLDEMRQVCKYGKPHKRDQFWYERFHEILRDRDLDV